MPDTPELLTLLQRLVAIDSVNPALAAGTQGEQALAHFVASWLEEHGLETSLEQTDLEQRSNVVAVIRGSGGGRSLLLNAHLDTVGVSGMEAPFNAIVENGRLHGRGALDTKAGLAAVMLAAVEAKRRSLRGDVILTAVVDEEYASRGTEALIQRWRADAAIVMEPTSLNIVIAHKGFVWLEVETKGIAAHGSKPEAGVDAIMKMGKALSALDDLAQQISASSPHPQLGTGSLHASLIQGGQEWSSYPASCRLSIERRTIPGETADMAEAEIQRLLDTISAEDSTFQASVRTVFGRKPLSVSPQSPLAEILRRHASKARGRELALTGFSGWTDAALLSGAGIPSVVFGPSGGGLHGLDEWVDLASVQQCYESVLATLEEFCS
jgi:acetylornithine deacetylase